MPSHGSPAMTACTVGLYLVSGSPAAPSRHRPSLGSHRYSSVPGAQPHLGQGLLDASCRRARVHWSGEWCTLQGSVGSGGGTGSPWESKRLSGQGDGWEETERLTASFRPPAGIEKASGQAIL